MLFSALALGLIGQHHGAHQFAAADGGIQEAHSNHTFTGIRHLPDFTIHQIRADQKRFQAGGTPSAAGLATACCNSMRNMISATTGSDNPVRSPPRLSRSSSLR